MRAPLRRHLSRVSAAIAVAALALASSACGRRAPANAIVKGLTEIEHVHLGGDQVYWRGHDAILRANKDGSDTRSIVQVELSDFAVDTVAIYYSSETGGSVSSVPLAGGMQTALATKLGKPSRMAQDFVFLYVCNREAEGSILKVPKGGGSVKVLAEKQSQPEAITVDEKSVYFGTNNGQIMKVSKSGGAPARLDAETAVVTDIAVDDAAVYWTLSFGPTTRVVRIGKEGDKKADLAKFDGESPRLAVSGAFVFVSAEIDGHVVVQKVRVDGKGQLEKVGSARGENAGLAADATHVFSGVRDPKGEDGWIVKLPR
ncbi:MAG TPA: DUF5050 domain-containing protein [Byssovorax sp.]